MSWWNAKYKNGHGEYEITFASNDYEKTKAVEKLCQAIIDQKVKSPDDLPPYISGKGANVPTKADRIRAMSDEEMATELMPLFEELCEDGIPSPEYMQFWLKLPYAKEDA